MLMNTLLFFILLLLNNILCAASYKEKIILTDSSSELLSTDESDSEVNARKLAEKIANKKLKQANPLYKKAASLERLWYKRNRYSDPRSRGTLTIKYDFMAKGIKEPEIDLRDEEREKFEANRFKKKNSQKSVFEEYYIGAGASGSRSKLSKKKSSYQEKNATSAFDRGCENDN